GHDGVGLAEERLAHQTRAQTASGTLDGGAQTGAPRADDQDVVLEGLNLGDVEHRLAPGADVVNNAHRQQTNVQVGEGDPEETRPGPQHVTGVEGRHPLPYPVAHDAASIAREAVEPPHDEVAPGMAAERVGRPQRRVDKEHDAPDAGPGSSVAEEGLEGIGVEDEDENDGEIE